MVCINFLNPIIFNLYSINILILTMLHFLINLYQIKLSSKSNLKLTIMISNINLHFYFQNLMFYQTPNLQHNPLIYFYTNQIICISILCILKEHLRITKSLNLNY